MMNKYILLILISTLIFTGCESMNHKKIEKSTSNQDQKETYSSQPIIEQTPYKLWIQDQEYELKLYEPKEGAYIGAYVLSNQSIDFDMEQFDHLTNKIHSTYLRNMKLGEPFPEEWILQCIAKMKTPHIILHPPTEEYPYQEHLIEETAQKFGEFYVPMFLEFYPNPSDLYGDGKQYKEFYQKARKIFSQYASNVAFIWSIDSKNVYDGYIYYPGDEAVDWIGLNLYIPIYDDGIKNYEDPMKTIEDFYYIYQMKKPLMISQLGISHYSNVDHRYYVEEAADTLQSVYEYVYHQYPRIKAINYMDFDNIKVAPQQQGMDNFSITEQSVLLDLYQQVIKPEYFIDTVDMQNSGFMDEEWFVIRESVYKRGSKFYIPETVLSEKWFSEKNTNIQKDAVVTDEKAYYPLDLIGQYWDYQLFIDEEKKIIYLKK